MQDFWNEGDNWHGGPSEMTTPQDLFSVEEKLSILFRFFSLCQILPSLCLTFITDVIC